MAAATEHFHEHGYVVVPGYLGPDIVGPAQDELGLVFPTPEDYFGDVDPDRNARFRNGQFAGLDQFPYESVEWSLLGLCDPILDLAAALLGSADLRLYEAHNWAKYGGTVDYDQPLHRDFSNHELVVPSEDPAFGAVEMFIFVHDIGIDDGPTYVASRHHAAHLPIWPPQLKPREDFPEVYRHEVPAIGPAGTVLAYKTSTPHRGSRMNDPKGSRFLVKSSFKVRSELFVDRVDYIDRLWWPQFQSFVERATPRQLEVVGFPPQGHAYWTSETYAGTCLRYPDADLSAFAPATD